MREMKEKQAHLYQQETEEEFPPGPQSFHPELSDEECPEVKYRNLQ